MLVQTDVRYSMELVTESELWLLNGVCLILLILYIIEKKVKNRMMEEWAEEGN